MKYAVMPMTDYENICNAVREKSGKTDLLKSGDVSGEISAVEVGGDIDSLSGGTITEASTNLVNIRPYAFASCQQLTTAKFPFATKIPDHCFNDDTNLKTIEMPNVTTIGYFSFNSCKNFELFELPSGLIDIKNYAFGFCTGLKSITFKSTPTSIASSVFTNCTNLLTINVPWAEGEVANAPWGATNATINYNYTGE